LDREAWTLDVMFGQCCPRCLGSTAQGVRAVLRKVLSLISASCLRSTVPDVVPYMLEVFELNNKKAALKVESCFNKFINNYLSGVI
jgi:hypothetical protein